MSAELNANAVVLDSPAITMLFTIIRDKRTTQRDYVGASDRLMAILAEEGLARLPCVAPVTVETPCGAYAGLAVPPTDRICGVDIVRSGGILLEAVRRIAPDSKTAKILIQRDEGTAEPKLFYSKLPPDVAELMIVLCDPMLATGGSALTAIQARRRERERARLLRKASDRACSTQLPPPARGAPSPLRTVLGAQGRGRCGGEYHVSERRLVPRGPAGACCQGARRAHHYGRSRREAQRV